MRPESIRRFDLFYLGALVVSAFASFMGYGAAMQQAEAQAAASGVEINSTLVIGSLAFGILISLLLWYLVSRKGFAIAKWVIVLFFLIGLVSLPGIFRGGLATFETISLVSLALQAVAIWYLFQPDAKAWFSGERATETDETLA